MNVRGEKKVKKKEKKYLNLAKLHHFGAKNVTFKECMDPKRVHTFIEVVYYKNTCTLETNRHPHN